MGGKYPGDPFHIPEKGPFRRRPVIEAEEPEADAVPSGV